MEACAERNLDLELTQLFGIEGFRNAQKDIIESLLNGQDTLTVMPTGGGKSLCYQLPGLLLEGVTLVVSPLISLMQDQVDGLRDRGIDATLINSTLSLEELDQRFRDIREGAHKLVYVAPERFRNERFMRMISEVKVGLFAVDEAHCISQWGHDFRPDYVRLGEAIERLGRPVVGAFTATATEAVRGDIMKALGLRDPNVFISGFSRPNLRLRVVHAGKKSEKMGRLGKLIEDLKTGIVYCATRKQVEKVTDMLKDWDYSVVMYHGGMSDDDRRNAQDAFMSGRVDVAVATNAFGMGIDRSDIRFVAHYEMPGSVEAYYQEVGRAGRDGKESICELYYTYADKRVQEFFIEGSNPSKQVIQNVFKTLLMEATLQNEVYMSIDDIAERMGKGTNPMAVSTAISMLYKARIIDRFDIPGQRIKGTRLLDPDLVPQQLPIDYGVLAEKEERDRDMLESVIRLATGIGCRQKWILKYFGEEAGEDCGCCDQCEAGMSVERRAPTADEAVMVQKALSGVARMSWRETNGSWIARYGKGKVIQMLVGSNMKWIRDQGINQLSTYGILQDVGRDYLMDLFREFELAGLVKEDKRDKFPLVKLTALGEKVMRGFQDYELNWPEKEGDAIENPPARVRKKGVVDDEGLEIDEELLELLKKKRSEVARAMKNARLFMVFGNKTLNHMAAKKPTTIEEALELPGIGPTKARTVLPKFLEVIQQHIN